MAKVSIIIPVYNAELYLDRCLQSIQKIHNIDWECVIINDGSKDRTHDILEKYGKEDRRFQIHHVENGGVSRARNIGMQVAKGDVFFFLDADDYLLEAASQCLYDALRDFQKNEIIVFGHKKVYSDGTEKEYKYPDITNLNYKESIKKLVILTHSLNPCWGKFLDANIIRKHNLLFDETMKVGEDAWFIMKYLEHASSVKMIMTPVIAYWHNLSGAMRKAGIHTIYDEIKTFVLRNEIGEKLELNITSKEYSEMCNTYVLKFIGYTLAETKKVTFKELLKSVKVYYEISEVRQIICSSNSNQFKVNKKLLLLLLKKKWYKMFCLMMCIYGKIGA